MLPLWMAVHCAFAADPIVASSVPETEASSSVDSSDESEIFLKVDKKAEFPGGMAEMNKFSRSNLRYPQEALDKEIQGTVYLTFVVLKDGSITDIKVIRSAHELLDNEAIRMVKSMPKWTPAQVDGKDCASYFTLPMNFKLTTTVSTAPSKKGRNK